MINKHENISVGVYWDVMLTTHLYLVAEVKYE
jgi:hypothetical protein